MALLALARLMFDACLCLVLAGTSSLTFTRLFERRSNTDLLMHLTRAVVSIFQYIFVLVLVRKAKFLALNPVRRGGCHVYLVERLVIGVGFHVWWVAGLEIVNISLRMVVVVVYAVLVTLCSYLLCPRGFVFAESRRAACADAPVVKLVEVPMRTYKSLGEVPSPFGVQRCCVCMNDFDVDDTVAQLICKHVFHRQCIEAWLSSVQIKRSCVDGAVIRLCPLRCPPEKE
eukprot:TRINITY_DN74571_c0_g1_i1.p1 TRINITY_DN74571_c0_g1~~TRINITY_DN74571_c0_g1_i1.p1  ORF type:complete len:251 (-),score=13.27 TRINITY_DN74571_c0_g1_i1:552-1238(-)